jgi:Mn2+/Fe2+ NRAMP family transporter
VEARLGQEIQAGQGVLPHHCVINSCRAVVNFSNIDPIKALIYAAVINGIIAVPLLVAIMKIGNDKQILEARTNSKLSNVLGWITVGVMGFSVIAMFLTWMV